MADPYAYELLPDPANSIRLLSIDPAWPSEPLTVQLITVPDRHTVPPYRALSYVWGSPSDPASIKCNGHDMQITRNLDSALRALRPLPADGDPSANGMDVLLPSHILHSSYQVWGGIARNRNEEAEIDSRRYRPGNPRQLLWVDAVCINQGDLHEQAEQVKGMRNIYSTAETVLIWLGAELTEPDGSPLQLPPMPTSRWQRTLGRVRLAELGHMPVVLTFLVQALRNAGRVEESENGLYLDEVGFPLRQSPEYQILAAFFNQTWFHRVWIVQEAALARQAQIIVGDWELDWEPFARAVTILHATSDISGSYLLKLRMTGVESKEVVNGLATTAALYLCDLRSISSRTKHLLPLLSDSRTRRATKPVDHVYALLGMAEELASPTAAPNFLPRLRSELLSVNYQKPVAEVFRDATWYIVLTHATLRPLLMAELTDDSDIPGCPSWVPIWSQPRKSVALNDRIFNAHHGQTMKIQQGTTLNMLCVSAYSLDSVTALNGGLVNPDRPNGQLAEWHYPPQQEEINFAASAWTVAMDNRKNTNSDRPEGQLLPVYHSDEQVLEAFAYTLSGNWDDSSPDGRGDGPSRLVESARPWFEKHIEGFANPGSLLTRAKNTIREMFYYGIDLGFQSSLLRACLRRRFFMTERGFMGIGPMNTRQGDILAVILGLPVPFVLRRVEGSNPAIYNLVGECYVHGVMDGELVQRQSGLGKQPEVFNLV